MDVNLYNSAPFATPLFRRHKGKNRIVNKITLDVC